MIVEKITTNENNRNDNFFYRNDSCDSNMKGNFSKNSYGIKSIYNKSKEKLNTNANANISFGHNVNEEIIKEEKRNSDNNESNKFKDEPYITETKNDIKLYRPFSSKRLLDSRPFSSIVKTIKSDCDQVKNSLKNEKEFDWNYKDFLKSKNARFQYYERSNYVLKHHNYNKINDLCFNDLENVKVIKEKIKKPGNKIVIKDSQIF